METTKAKTTNLTGAWKRASETREERQQTSSQKLLVQFIAYGQLVFAALSLLLVVVMILYGISFTVVVNEDPDKTPLVYLKNTSPPYGTYPEIICIVWTEITVFAVDTLLQLWASTRLLQATESGISKSDALKCIRFWWNYTVISTVVETVPILLTDYYGIGLLFIVFRFSFLFHVRAFRKTVEKKVMSARAAFKGACGNPNDIKIVIPQ